MHHMNDSKIDKNMKKERKTLSHWLRRRIDWKDHSSVGVGNVEIDGAVLIRHMKPTAFTSGLLPGPS